MHTAGVSVAKPSGCQAYRVGAGDTLFGIAEKASSSSLWRRCVGCMTLASLASSYLTLPALPSYPHPPHPCFLLFLSSAVQFQVTAALLTQSNPALAAEGGALQPGTTVLLPPA